MKTNSSRDIESRLKEVFTPSYLLVEQSALVAKKYKILIVSKWFKNKSNTSITPTDNHRMVYQSLKDKIKVQQPLIEELDIATFKPTEYQEGNTIQLTTYKYNDMLPHFSKQLII
tara:strand:- start:6745 stop:7089 length:345 start_codon:yes stop_codon:yes gene_type:complete